MVKHCHNDLGYFFGYPEYLLGRTLSSLFLMVMQYLDTVTSSLLSITFRRLPRSCVESMWISIYARKVNVFTQDRCCTIP